MPLGHVALGFILASSALQAWLLYRIINHPAGGWGDDLRATFITALFICGIPMALGVLAAAKNAHISSEHYRALGPLGILAVVGPAFYSLGLLQYGHITPGLMLFAFVIQFICAVIALLLSRHAT